MSRQAETTIREAWVEASIAKTPYPINLDVVKKLAKGTFLFCQLSKEQIRQISYGLGDKDHGHESEN